MASKCDVFVITIEFLLFAYIFQDIYVSVFMDPIPNDVVVGPGDSIILNSTKDDPKITGIGKFAVDEYNRFSRSELKLQRVVKAMFMQSSYMLLIQAADGTSSDSKHYAAVVLVRGDEMRLAAFQEYVDSDISTSIY